MRLRLTLTAALALAVAVPVALATTGKGSATTSAGGKTLTVAASVTPDRASVKGKPRNATLGFKQRLVSQDGSRITQFEKFFIVRVPQGSKIATGAFSTCRESVLAKPKGTCPAKSRVGSGTAIVDARPTVPKPVTAVLTTYNGIIDQDAAGKPAPARPGLLAVAVVKSLNNYTAFFPFTIKRNVFTLDQGAEPADHSSGLFIVRDVNLAFPSSLTGKQHRSYYATPGTCPRGGWKVSNTVTFPGHPSLSATATLPCRK